MVQLFSVPAFFILFRETLEASIILSVMLALIHKIVEDKENKKRMTRKVWLGTIAGAVLSFGAAVIFLSLYYTVAKKAWDSSESLWEGILGLVAVPLITVMAFSMVRVNTWRKKWEKKLTKVTLQALHREQDMERKRSKYAMFLIPFTVVLREGVEAVIFLGGIGLQGSGTGYPIPAVLGAACGILVGYFLFKGGSHVAFKWFLRVATVLLLVIAAGVFANSVHEFEEYRHTEQFIWQLSCCDGEGSDGWALLGAVVGWRNEATRGTLTAYVLYWVFVTATFVVLRIKWSRQDELDSAAARADALAHEPPPLAAGVHDSSTPPV